MVVQIVGIHILIESNKFTLDIIQLIKKNQITRPDNRMHRLNGKLGSRIKIQIYVDYQRRTSTIARKKLGHLDFVYEDEDFN